VIPGGCGICSLAFQFCRSLTTVTLGMGCTKIDGSAFRDCTALASVVLPRTLKSIGWEAFRGCLALSTIAIPKDCQVHRYAFIGSKTRVTDL
jgi:hypothetical protein